MWLPLVPARRRHPWLSPLPSLARDTLIWTRLMRAPGASTTSIVMESRRLWSFSFAPSVQMESEWWCESGADGLISENTWGNTSCTMAVEDCQRGRSRYRNSRLTVLPPSPHRVRWCRRPRHSLALLPWSAGGRPLRLGFKKFGGRHRLQIPQICRRSLRHRVHRVHRVPLRRWAVACPSRQTTPSGTVRTLQHTRRPSVSPVQSPALDVSRWARRARHGWRMSSGWQGDNSRPRWVVPAGNTAEAEPLVNRNPEASATLVRPAWTSASCCAAWTRDDNAWFAHKPGGLPRRTILLSSHPPLLFSRSFWWLFTLILSFFFAKDGVDCDIPESVGFGSGSTATRCIRCHTLLRYHTLVGLFAWRSCFLLPSFPFLSFCCCSCGF